MIFKRILFIVFIVALGYAAKLQTDSTLEQRFAQTRDYYFRGKLDSAFTIAKNLIIDAPGFTKIYYWYGANFSFFDIMETDSFIKGLIKADPANGYAWYSLGLIATRKRLVQESEAFHHLSKDFTSPLSLDETIACFKKSIALNPGFGGPLGAAFGLGEIYDQQGDRQLALHYYRQAVNCKDYDIVLRLKTYQSMYKIYRETEQADAADEIKHKILDLLKEIEKSPVLLPTENFLNYSTCATAFMKLGLKEQALSISQRYLDAFISECRRHPQMYIAVERKAELLYGLYKIFKQYGDVRYTEKVKTELINLPNDRPDLQRLLGREKKLAQIYYELGAKWKAYKTCQELIKNARSQQVPFYEYWAYATLGSIVSDLGDYRQGLAYNFRALRVAREHNIKVYNPYGTIGAIYTQLGSYDLGLQYLNKALYELRQQDQHYLEAYHLSNIGFNLVRQEKYRESLVYFEDAAQVYSSNGNKDNSLTSYRTAAAILHGIGKCYFGLQDYEKAKKYYQQALKTAADDKIYYTQVDILISLGKLYLMQKETAQALASFKKARVILKKSYFNQLAWQADLGLGECYLRNGYKLHAIRHLTNVVTFSDSLRMELDEESLSATVLNDKYRAYQLLADIYIHDKQLEKAYTVIEKYKSLVMLHVLSRNRSVFSNLLSDSTAFRINDLSAAIEQLHNQVSQLSEEANPHADEMLLLKQQLAELEIKKAAVQDSLQHNNPALQQMIAPQPLTVSDVQSQLLHPAVSLLEFVVDDKKTLVFAITQNDLQCFELAVSRDTLKTVLSGLSSLYRLKKAQDIQFNTNILDAKMAGFTLPALHRAYNLLIKPLRPFLANSRQLIIIPDDLLYYLPFEALVSDTAGTEGVRDFSRARYLLQDFEISYVPSASVLSSQLDHGYADVPYDLLALGNPDYSHLQIQDSLQLSQPSYIRGLKNLQPLPHARTEVKQIARILQALKSKIFFDSQATEDNFKAYAARSRILHLATHFMTNDREPLYSKIALAREDGSGEDGFLQPFEIFNMHLKADLVVLSACNTALGEISKGEGIIGITRAFQYAGSPSLLVSQWNVDDRASSVLMTSFYGYLKKGWSKSGALRQAKLDYLQGAGGVYKDPFYWAPFILIGNPQAIEFERAGYMVWWFVLAGLLLLVAGWFWRKWVSKNSLKI